MIVNIYDVAHGFCAYVRDEITGRNTMFDCGYNEETGFHPVDEVLDRFGPIGGLTIQNFDEDHINGLPHLIKRAGPTPVGVLSGNPISNLQLLALKGPSYSKSLAELVFLRERYTGGPPSVPVGSPRGEAFTTSYFNPYPLFRDTNNLSYVTFVHGPGYSIVFPGDLEKQGWKALLQNANFRADLAKVKVFVASHHGRESGYCEEVFNYCKPDIVVISDEPMQFDTQNHEYAQHATGLYDQTAKKTRRVLTTRCDGHLRIGSPLGYRYFISYEAA